MFQLFRRAKLFDCRCIRLLIRARLHISSNMTTRDPSSLSNLDAWTTKHLRLGLEADFGASRLSGSAVLNVKRIQDVNAKTLCLDTRDLSISGVKCNDEAVEYTLHPPNGCFGQKLEIDVSRFDSLEEMSVGISYATSPKSSALQWLSALQTFGRQHPYMFSQCQAIHARSLLPCQDSPAVKASYTAEIRAPKELNVLMSAARLRTDGPSGNLRAHHFEQKVPIPSYLIAIVIGNLESRKIGPRSHVWSEPEMVDAAAAEFADTEAMIQAGEALCGPYIWGLYDLLVLPPSFPYGGMENPCLTFVTPTLLAGDKSLANVVAHEIAHSWTGNLVTNVNWEHFWLNEGHTVYLERKIIKRLHGERGESLRHLYILGGRQSLGDEIQRRGDGNALTALVPNLDGVDPDDAFSCVPYEKGSGLLFSLESLIGEELMDKWLRAYVEQFHFRSIDTAEWKEFLYFFFKDKVDRAVLDGVDWDAWLHRPGFLPHAPALDGSLATAATDLADAWAERGCGDADPDGAAFVAFAPPQRMLFLDNLRHAAALGPDQVGALTRHYRLHETRNAEIRFRWLALGLNARCEAVVDAAVTFLNEQGRMKFTRPLYRALAQWEEKRPLAVKNFEEQRRFMHPITAQMVASDLGLS